VLVSAAVVPSPPALVPEVASGAVADLAAVRAAAVTAVERMLAAAPQRVVVVAAAQETGRRDTGERADLAAYGVDLVVPGGGSGPGRLPLGHVLGLWLLAQTTAYSAQEVICLGVADDLDPDDCAQLGGELATAPLRTALLCVGDGSARRGAGSPRWPDPRAVPWDEKVTAALGAADLAVLAALDPATAHELAAAGRAPWQVLAGAAAAAGEWTGELLCASAPYGVGYVVASWAPATATSSS
jgi:hypothetical protein